ncbi:proliferating cell nuclear antigen [Faustovirus]|nr:proliferating cell nuclear antigen [Faustovirus]
MYHIGYFYIISNDANEHFNRYKLGRTDETQRALYKRYKFSMIVPNIHAYVKVNRPKGFENTMLDKFRQFRMRYTNGNLTEWVEGVNIETLLQEMRKLLKSPIYKIEETNLLELTRKRICHIKRIILGDDVNIVSKNTFNIYFDIDEEFDDFDCFINRVLQTMYRIENSDQIYIKNKNKLNLYSCHEDYDKVVHWMYSCKYKFSNVRLSKDECKTILNNLYVLEE